MYRMAPEVVRQLQNTSQDGKQPAAQKEHFILRESFLLVTNITLIFWRDKDVKYQSR